MPKANKVAVRWVKGGKQESMGEGFANVLTRIGLVERVIVEPVQAEKKKRGRPRKVAESEAVTEPEAGKYKRRDLRPED